jgi:transcriptional regulator with XRE-family HTH domain
MTPATAAATRKAWGDTLRGRRETSQLTQERLAEIAGIDQASVSRAEAGTGSLETYLRIAKALDVTLEVAS